MLMSAKTPASWCTKRRPSARDRAGVMCWASTFLAPTVTTPPASACSTPAMSLTSVDFPDPLPPTSAWSSPPRRLSETLLRARMPG
jgi:hypothetical protein